MNFDKESKSRIFFRAGGGGGGGGGGRGGRREGRKRDAKCSAVVDTQRIGLLHH